MEATIRVPAMTCTHCTRAVESGLLAVPGVTAVTADLESKLVTVTGEQVGDEALRAAVAEAGYEAE